MTLHEAKKVVGHIDGMEEGAGHKYELFECPTQNEFSWEVFKIPESFRCELVIVLLSSPQFRFGSKHGLEISVQVQVRFGRK